MNTTQLTHHDLDGYGASTVVGRFRDVRRVVHIPRYSDVGPVVETELKRLERTKAPELLILTDLGLEEVAVTFIRRFAQMNLKREAERRHRLVVLDHHASSIDQLRAQKLEPQPDPERPALNRFDTGDPDTVVLIDAERCATRMAYEQRALYAPEAGEGDADLATLVAAVDALDLWRKDRPEFLGGLALDEAFWDNVSTLIPVGHPWHDRFVGGLLMALAALLREGLNPAGIEARLGAVRLGLVDDLMAGDPDDDAGLTTRMRVARALARSEELFRPLSDGTLLSFGLDSGAFQRISDLIMEAGRAKRVVNVQRVGTLSFRSNNETALDGARKFRGGGHRDAAGGRLQSGAAFSLADAIAQVEPVLNPPAPDPDASPFAALRALKG